MSLLRSILAKDELTNADKIRIIESWCESFYIEEHPDGSAYVSIKRVGYLPNRNEYRTTEKALRITMNVLTSHIWRLCALIESGG